MTHFIFDCDDVLLDWETAFIAFFEKASSHKLDTAGPQSWAINEWLGCAEGVARQWVEMFNGSAAFGQLKARPGARELIWGLRNAGHTISVLTACGDNRAVQWARYTNLMEAFDLDDPHDMTPLPFDTITMLPLGASKFTFLYEFTRNRDPGDVVFVEDSFEHAKSGAANGIRSYCLRRSHNHQQEAENPHTSVIWIDDLDAIRLDFISSIQPNVDEATEDRIGRCNRCGTALREEPDGWSDCPRCQGSY